MKVIDIWKLAQTDEILAKATLESEFNQKIASGETIVASTVSGHEQSADDWIEDIWSNISEMGEEQADDEGELDFRTLCLPGDNSETHPQ